MNKYIDHTLLKADAGLEDINHLIEEALEYHFYSVCVNPCYVKKAKEALKDKDVKVCTVIGFPLGQNTVETKVFEAINAVKNGADEIDMVINIAALKAKNQKYVFNEIKHVRDAIPQETVLKVIIEVCLLEDEEIALASQIAAKAGADFVKTSTGFSTGGATVKAINIIKDNIPEGVGIKASGGIVDIERAKLMVDTGATRIGSSKSVIIVKGQQ
ncbi:MAG: deoxyribose-phosphate aldolase [Bacillota bacterium]|nr:deoxyribose-phosphate aldolase [Bacillota bacterium]